MYECMLYNRETKQHFNRIFYDYDAFRRYKKKCEYSKKIVFCGYIKY